MSQQSSHAKPNKRENAFVRIFNEHLEVALTSAKNLWQNFGKNLITWMTLAITLALPGVLIWLLIQTQALVPDAQNANHISVFLAVDIVDERAQTLARNIDASQDIAAVEYVSRERALKEFSDASGLEDIIASMVYNPLPITLLVTLEQSGVDNIDEIVVALSALDGVDQVLVNQQWLERMLALVELSGTLIWLMAILMALGVLLVMGNTVRLQMEYHRDEILVIKLAGGTSSYVRRPFLYSALWSGLIAGVIASIIMIVGIAVLQDPFANVAESFVSTWELNNLSIQAVLVTILASCLLSFVATYITLLKHLHTIEPS